MIHNLSKLDTTKIYHLMADTVIPRPIAWIVTINDNIINIAPMIENATVAYSCTFNQLINIGNTKTQPIMLNVEKIYINENKKFNPMPEYEENISC